jgi:hypothetical protein
MPNLTLSLLAGSFAIHRFPADAPILQEIPNIPFYSATLTRDELSVVAPETVTLQSGSSEGGWACLKVNGPLEFSQVGILAGLSAALASAKVSIFVISTFDTDYILVKAEKLQRAITALEAAGYMVHLAS